ncbi:MAG: mechanosensitive ion channel family protein [Hormoscilla sp.]
MLPQIQETLLNLKNSAIASLPALVLTIFMIILTVWGANFTRKLVAGLGDRTEKSKSLRSLFVQLSYIAAWTVGILSISVVAFPDLRLGDIISLLGFGSVAIGFAFQDIFKNFLAGVLLLLQQPFQLDDEVIIQNYQGPVEYISIRSTQIRTYQGELVVLPNALVFTSPVEVLTNWKQRETMGVVKTR